MGRLEGKVTVITGGAGGIGRAAAKRFVEEGSDVLIVDVDEAALAQVVSEVGSNKISYFVADVTSAEGNQAMIDMAEERYGGVDVLLANAGIEGDVAPITEYSEEKFDQVMAVNVKGPFLGLKAAIPALAKRGGGSVVVTSSVAGLQGAAGVAPYSTSKHAVIGLMRSAAKEVAAQNIRVNTVNPSPVETRMMRSLEAGMGGENAEEVKKGLEQSIPMGKYAEPEDIANIMLFLASEDAKFITGSVYAADGGFTA